MPSGSRVEEKVYDWRGSQDFEKTIQLILQMDPHQAVQMEKKLLTETNSMNTYVYTKNLAELYIARYRGNLRTVISRPSMVTGAYKEPLIGWTDTVSAAGIVVFPAMTGLQRNIFMHDISLCTVPVDLVSNGIIASSAAAA